MPLRLCDLANCLLAGAAGDCIGGPYEGAEPRDVELPHGRWKISDDTVLSIATARALLGSGGVDPASIAASLVDEFSHRGIPGLGASTLKALRDLKAGAHWALAGRRGEHAAGNGAAMRIAPLAFFVDATDPAHRQTIRDVCRITHHNDEAYVAGLAVLLAMQLPQGTANSMAQIAHTLPDTRVRDTLWALADLPPDTTVRDAAKVSGISGYAPESVPLALFVAMAATDLKAGLFAAVSCGGDTDTIASIAGQVLGAHGHRVPDDWIQRIPCAEVVRILCEGSS